MQDLDPERVASYPVASYVWAVLKVRALSQELGRAVLEVEQHETALASLRQGGDLLGRSTSVPQAA